MAKRRPVSIPAMPACIPTPETMQHAVYEMTRVEKNGHKVAVNRTPTPLARILRLGKITTQQMRAGEAFEQNHAVAWPSYGARDSTVPRIGGEVHETESARISTIAAKDRLRKVQDRLTVTEYSKLVDVTVYHQRYGRTEGGAPGHARMVRALDVCADVFGIPVTDREDE